MKSLGIIKKEIEKYLDMNLREFVIYPFGKNGIDIKTILMNCYGIIPRLIVDNNLYKYNPEIVSKENLKTLYCPNMVILITADDRKIVNEILDEIEEYVPEDRVVILSSYKGTRNIDINDFQLDNILPDYIKTLDRINIDKIRHVKVRIVHTTQNAWNSLKTVCLAFKTEPGIELLVIGGLDNDEIKKRQTEDIGVKYIHWSGYSAKEDLPDILIVSHPYDNDTQLEGIEKIAKLRVVMSMQLLTYCNSINEFWKQQNSAFGRYKPNMYIYDSLIYKYLETQGNLPKNVYEMGNAKFDGIFCALQEKKHPYEWRKLEGKKIILWTTDHGVINGEGRDDVTFDLYAKPIFQYFHDRPELGIIFRPHSTFIYELLDEGIWTEDDLKSLREYCVHSENIVFDETENYDAAYSVSDAIIADAHCGIVCSALPTGKPICLTYVSREERDYHEEIVSAYHKAYCPEDLYAFFEMVRRGDDLYQKEREELAAKYIKHFDGKNGMRMKDFLLKKYREL